MGSSQREKEKGLFVKILEFIQMAFTIDILFIDFDAVAIPGEKSWVVSLTLKESTTPQASGTDQIKVPYTLCDCVTCFHHL